MSAPSLSDMRRENALGHWVGMDPDPRDEVVVERGTLDVLLDIAEAALAFDTYEREDHSTDLTAYLVQLGALRRHLGEQVAKVRP